MDNLGGRQAVFWGAMFVAFLILLLVLKDVLMPFVLGLTLAYFLNPIANSLEKTGVSRLTATILIAIVFGVLSILFFVLIGPLLFRQMSELLKQIPSDIAQLMKIIVTSSEAWFGKIFPGQELGMEEAMHNMAKDATSNLTGVLNSIWSSGKAVFGFMSTLLITPVVTFFLLLDWNPLIKKIDGWLPRDHAPVIRLLTRRINRAIHGFIHGQVIVSLILGIFYSIALSLAGLKYGLLVGVTAGAINIIPFFGSLGGFIISGALALVQYWPQWQPILTVLLIFLFGQLFDSNFLTPKIIGDKIKLHPVWLIFALIAAGYLFGIFGMLVAIPVAAAIGVIVRYSLERYLVSSFYKGRTGRDLVPRKNISG